MYGLKPVPFKLKPVPFKLKPVPFRLKPVPFKGGDTQDYFNKLPGEGHDHAGKWEDISSIVFGWCRL